MNDTTYDDSFVFIIGSPRSGTTVLGEILDKHKNISQWYEPYFVWDRHFRNSPNDERTAEDATSKVQNQIYADFINYKRKINSKIVVDKSPRNSLKIPFILEIFPKARFIHIVRDGRDVTLSIHKEWVRRSNIVSDNQRKRSFNYSKAFEVISQWLNRQAFFKYKLRAFWFETHGHFLDKTKHLNRLRWNGEVGWGPRFKGWDKIFSQNSILQFNAYQWLKCLESIHSFWTDISADRKLEIRYEDFITQGVKLIKTILDFLGMEIYEEFFDEIPKLKKNNFNKWQTEFSQEQIKKIHPILTPLLAKLGYENNHYWS
jgi:hypothetical protein